MMRVAFGGFYHETNSFATPKTPLELFSVYRGAAIDEIHRGGRTNLAA